jgi:[protein-PII] uridylyltransferase
MLESLAARHTRHGDLAQSLEPEIKEAKGGLRDLTILAALAEAWLAQRPRGEVVTATGLLLDVRDAIHVVTGRGRDRLLRQDHDAVAALLGHDDADDLLTEISDAGRVIAHSLDAAMRRASQAQRARLLRVGPRRPQMTPLGYGLFVSDGELVLGHDRLLTDPVLPLRAAALAATHGVPIAPATLTNLAKVPPLPVPWPDEAREQLGNLLASGPGLVPVWEGLDQAGIIGSWFPEWSTVRSRPQRSPVHRHTVDRHLVETVVHAGGMVREVSRPDLLLIAALLHDIGKVKGARDHSLEGAPLARAIVERMGHPEADVALVERLVREHLTLVELATRRDHADPGTVEAAISASGGTLAGFDLLRALTEADAAAAGPAAWTDWRSSLVAQLTTAVRARLDPDAPEPDDPAPRAQPADVERAVRAGRVHVEARSSGSAWRLDIISTDRLGLFADTAGVLAVEGLIVRTAIVRTLDGLAVNEWHVESPRVENPDPARIGRLIERLATGDLSPLVALEKRRNRPTRPSATADTASPGQARAMIVPGASPDATVLEVRAQDRPALLHDLGRTFTDVFNRSSVRPADRDLPQEPARQGATLNRARRQHRPCRDIRMALLDADVALPVVKDFTRRSASGLSALRSPGAQPGGQQVVKIVNEELVEILGGRPGRCAWPRPADGHHAGRSAGLRQDDARPASSASGSRTRATLRCSSPPTCSGPTRSPSLRSWASAPACRSSPPSAATSPGTTRSVRDGGHPVLRRPGRGRRGRHPARHPKLYTTSSSSTPPAAWRSTRPDAAGRGHPRRDRARRGPVRHRRDDRPGRGRDRRGLPGRRRLHRCRAVQARRRRPRWCGAVGRLGDRRPIMFASTGEGVKDFEVFHPDRMASRILDMGDVLTLIEQAERPSTSARATRWSASSSPPRTSPSTTSSSRWRPSRRWARFKSMLGMMPGMNQMRAQLDALDEREFDRVEAMVRSMTPFERTHPKQINGSRRARIAKGSGVHVPRSTSCSSASARRRR